MLGDGLNGTDAELFRETPAVAYATGAARA